MEQDYFYLRNTHVYWDAEWHFKGWPENISEHKSSNYTVGIHAFSHTEWRRFDQLIEENKKFLQSEIPPITPLNTLNLEQLIARDLQKDIDFFLKYGLIMRANMFGAIL